MNFSVRVQKLDGSWFYGEEKSQKWIDSFHSGYNLVALSAFIKNTDLAEYKNYLIKGYNFYKKHFFLPDGTVKYYHNKAYPLDSHAFAHAIICLCELSHLGTHAELIEKIINKLISLFWSEKGYFYYRKVNPILIKIPYIRWVQAWVFLALVTYLVTNKVQPLSLAER